MGTFTQHRRHLILRQFAWNTCSTPTVTLLHFPTYATIYDLKLVENQIHITKKSLNLQYTNTKFQRLISAFNILYE